MLPVITVFALLVLWEVLARADTSRIRLVPPLSDVIQQMIEDRELLLTRHIPQTMSETLWGLGIAFVIGIFIAALLDFSPLLKRMLYPLLVFSQTIPIVAIAALLIVIFGFGIEPKVIVVVLYCFFPITVATVDGLTATDPDLVALLRAMGASRMQVWRKVRLPAALPSLFSGLRIAATYSVTGAVVGEYLGSQYGLGYYLLISVNGGQQEKVFVMVMITAILSIALVVIVAIFERILMPWYFTEARQAQWNEPGIY